MVKSVSCCCVCVENGFSQIQSQMQAIAYCILHSARALRYPSIKLILLGNEELDLASSLSNTALMCKGTEVPTVL